MNSPVRLGVSPTASSTPTDVFSQKFEALFPHAGTLGCSVCLASQLFIQVYLHANVGPPSLQSAALLGPLATTLPASPSLARPRPPAASLPGVLPAQLPVSAPPTGLDECFFFNSLVVGLPCSSIFYQFWLFFVFKFIVVVFLVMQGDTACLPTPPSWPEGYVNVSLKDSNLNISPKISNSVLECDIVLLQNYMLMIL